MSRSAPQDLGVMMIICSFIILLGWKIEKNLVSKKALAAMTGEIHTTLEHSRIDEHS